MAPDLVSSRPVEFAAQPPRAQAALGLMVASGFAGLGYQIAWTQQSALWVGHEAVAVLAVIAAFFGGLAIGSLVLGPRIDRSNRPARWYAGCEALVALWSVAIAVLMAPLGNALIAWTGVNPAPAWQWTVAFGGTFLMLLPATAAMGATLPAMERLMASWGGDGRTVGALVACNTLGAVVGVIATAFWLIPEAGLLRTAAVCATLNLACAATALALPGGGVQRPATPVESGPSRGLWTLALTGLLGIGYELTRGARAQPGHREHRLHLRAARWPSIWWAPPWALQPTSADGTRRAATRCGPSAVIGLLMMLLAAACLFGHRSALWQARRSCTPPWLQALGPGLAAFAGLPKQTLAGCWRSGLPTLVDGSACSAHLCHPGARTPG